jgi:predicted dehydrogenase
MMNADAATRRPVGASRRRFLKTTAQLGATAVAAPLLIPRSVLGAEGKAAANDRIGLGLIGYGRQTAKYNTRQFAGQPEVDIVAVCDVDSWRLEQGAASKHVKKGALVTPDWHEVLASDAVDAVMIGTPDHWHAAMSIAAAEAGKDIACEKPINRCIAEGRAVADAVKKHGRVYRVDSEFRAKPQLHKMATLVRGGAIGELKEIIVSVPGSDVGCPPQPEMPVPEELDYDAWQGPAPRAPYTQKRVHPPKNFGRPGWMRHLYYCDGMITNWGAHMADIAAWCHGVEYTGPVEIEGTGTYPEPESFWNVLLDFEVRYKFPDGVTWTYVSKGPYVKCIGTEGWVRAGFAGGMSASSSAIAQYKVPDDAPTFPCHSEKRDLIGAIRSREQPMYNAESGHRVQTILLLGHIAIRTGEKLGWDPEKEQLDASDQARHFVDHPIHEE